MFILNGCQVFILPFLVSSPNRRAERDAYTCNLWYDSEEPQSDGRNKSYSKKKKKNQDMRLKGDLGVTKIGSLYHKLQ